MGNGKKGRDVLRHPGKVERGRPQSPHLEDEEKMPILKGYHENVKMGYGHLPMIDKAQTVTASGTTTNLFTAANRE